MGVITHTTTLPTPDKLRDLSRDELIAVVLLLMERVSQLEAEIAALKQKPPTGASSRNSSQPLSRDWKGNRPPSQRQRKKKRGAQPGHTKADRPLVDDAYELAVVVAK